MGQSLVSAARLDRDPADGSTVRVGQQAGDDARLHAGFLHLAGRLAGVFTHGLAAQFPEHAPAPAARAEEPLEIGEAVGGQGVKREGERGHFVHADSNVPRR